jgi:hypothetical protein
MSAINYYSTFRYIEIKCVSIRVIAVWNEASQSAGQAALDKMKKVW